MKLKAVSKIQKGAVLFLLIILVGTVFSYQTGFAQSPNTQAYIIQFKRESDASVLNQLGSNVRQRFDFNQSQVFKNIFTFDSPLPLFRLQNDLQERFNFLEINRSVAEQAIFLNDPGFTLNSQDIDKQWALPKLGFLEAWQKTTGWKGNIVAVIDTGVDGTHEDLQTINFVPGFNFISQESMSGNVNSDDNGHGTLVTGILGATQNNGLGIAGTNWAISVMPLKALDSSGRGDVATISEAIVWAADHGANFINLSVGGVGFAHDMALANAISYAFNKNVLIVAAAGNDMAATGGNLDQEPVYPICDDNNMNMVIGVAAVDQNDLKPEFSNYGKNCIDVVAPGKRILSTINHDPISKTAAPNSYAYASGTSLSVPFVVGEAALIRAMNPSATSVQIRDRIIASADSVDNLNLSQCGGLSCRGLLGAGRINVKSSLENLITTQAIKEGDLIKVEDSALIYQISGGKRRPISSFVMNQSFLNTSVKTVSMGQLNLFPEGPYLTPLEGTLVKLPYDPTVYMIVQGQKRPVSLVIFNQRNLSFSDVQTISYQEFDSWVNGPFLPPKEGTLMRGFNDKTVYWVVGQILHPINYTFYIERGLNVFPIMVISSQDLSRFGKGEPYIR